MKWLSELLNIKKPAPPKPDYIPTVDYRNDNTMLTNNVFCKKGEHFWCKWELVKQTEKETSLGATIIEINQRRVCKLCGFAEYHYHRSDGVK